MLGRYRSKPAATALRQVFGLLSFADEPAPARQSLALGLGRRELRDREAVAPLPGPRRVDDRARAEALLVRMDARVERARPRARDDVDRLGGLAPRAHRPEHLLEIHDVDVVVDDHGVAAEIRPGVDARRGVPHLARVTRVALVDRDRVEQARAADLMAPHADDAGDRRGLDVAAETRAPHERAVERLLVGWHVRRRRENDRVVAVVDGMDAEDGLGALARRVIAGPLAEGSLDLALFGVDPAFHQDLGVRGDREAGDRSLDDAIRRAAHPAGPVVLGRAVGDLGAGRQEKERIATRAEGERHALFAREPLIAMLPAVLAGRDVEAEPRLVVDHHAVRAEVHPALVRIARDVEAAGAEVAAAVELVPLRSGEDQAIDLVAAEHVLEDRAVLHDLGGDRLDALADTFLPRTDELVRRRVRVEAEGDRDAAERPEPVGEDAKTLLEALDLVEDCRLRWARPAEELGGHPDVLLRVRAADRLQLAERVDAPQPVPQIGGRRDFGRDRRGHMRLLLSSPRTFRRACHTPAPTVGEGTRARARPRRSGRTATRDRRSHRPRPCTVGS